MIELKHLRKEYEEATPLTDVNRSDYSELYLAAIR